mmetsp:Transcript_5060/g.8015  ORF Transcript_5060/g.8015 Transcript_5060/m.8015 type:complete len:395 (+) Transcript_5060:147-1331(+)
MKALILMAIVARPLFGEDVIVDNCDPLQHVPITEFRDSTCFTSQDLAARQIFPTKREGVKVRIELHINPTSQRISSLAAGILLKEAMGYDIEWTCASTTFNSTKRMIEDKTDIVLGYLQSENEPDTDAGSQSVQILDIGALGYTTQPGVYVPTYTKDVFLRQLGGGGGSGAHFAATAFTYYSIFSLPEIVELFTNANDSEIIRNNNLELRDTFTPPWCKKWNVEGVGNNCIDVKSEEVRLGTTLHQMIINLRLNMTVSYWGANLDGKSGVAEYVAGKLRRRDPFLLKHAYLPDKVFRSIPLIRVSFPHWSQRCYRNNTGYFSGEGSVDCDFPPSILRKAASYRVVGPDVSDEYNDLVSFIQRFRMSEEEINAVWEDILSFDAETELVTRNDRTE